MDRAWLVAGPAVYNAGIKDRDALPRVLKFISARWPWPLHLYSDGGYGGLKQKGELNTVFAFELEIVTLPDAGKTEAKGIVLV